LEDRLRAHWTEGHPADPENTFEEVTLSDEAVMMTPIQQHTMPPPSRRGFFARFGDNSTPAEKSHKRQPVNKNASSGFHMFSGRKHIVNVVHDAELESIPKPDILFVAVEE
jgi:hypothetical protein